MTIRIASSNVGDDVKIYWVKLEINFEKKIPLLDEKNRELPEGIIGFSQEIGCTADNEEELKEIINNYLRELEWIDQETEVVFDRIGEIEPNKISSEIYGDPDIKDSLRSNPRKRGIWYSSGRAFFSGDSD